MAVCPFGRPTFHPIFFLGGWGVVYLHSRERSIIKRFGREINDPAAKPREKTCFLLVFGWELSEQSFFFRLSYTACHLVSVVHCHCLLFPLQKKKLFAQRPRFIWSESVVALSGSSTHLRWHHSAHNLPLTPSNNSNIPSALTWHSAKHCQRWRFCIKKETKICWGSKWPLCALSCC